MNNEGKLKISDMSLEVIEKYAKSERFEAFTLCGSLGDCIYQLFCCGGRTGKRQTIIHHIEDLTIDEYNDIMRYIRINDNKTYC
jgi:hypothetical protein